MLSAVFDYLGGHVAHRAAAFVAFCGHSVVEDQRESEVDDVGFEGGGIDVDVLGFQVAVDDVVAVDVLDALEESFEDAHDDDGVGHLLFLPEGHEIFSF